MYSYSKLERFTNKTMNVFMKGMLGSLMFFVVVMMVAVIAQGKFGIEINQLFILTLFGVKMGSVMVFSGTYIILLLLGLIFQIFVLLPINLYVDAKKSLKFFKKPFDSTVITKEIVSKKIHGIVDVDIISKKISTNHVLGYIYDIITPDITREYQMKCDNEPEYLQFIVTTMRDDEFISKIKKRKSNDLLEKITNFMTETADYSGWDLEDPQIENYIKSETAQLNASFQTILTNSKMFKDLKVTKNC